jgi:hypothetical protein
MRFSSSDYDDYHGTGNRRSKSATYFKPSEGYDEQKYKRLWGYNEGLLKARSRVDTAELYRRDRLAVLDALASTLGLSDSNRTQAEDIIENTDFRGHNDTSLTGNIFAICALVYNHQQKTFGGNIYLPSKSDEDQPVRFEELRTELSLSEEEIQYAMSDLRGIVKEQ